MRKKSLFNHKAIRKLKNEESKYLEGVQNLLDSNLDTAIISYIPGFFSNDGNSRPLILTKEIVIKIEKKHGKINPGNLLINANDWNIAIKNIDKTVGKICLIKEIPNSKDILLIAALQRNGYFILSHYEVEILKDNQLKSLLGRGGFLERMPDHDPIQLTDRDIMSIEGGFRRHG